MMKKLKVLIMLMLFVSVLQGCSQKDPAEEHLKAAIKNNDALTSFHVESAVQGDYVDTFMFVKEDNPQKQYITDTQTIYKIKDYLYVHKIENDGNGNLYSAIERLDAAETYYITSMMQSENSKEATVIDTVGISANNHNNDYLGFLKYRLEEFSGCYDFTETESNGMKIIEVKLSNVKKFNQLEIERLRKDKIDPLKSEDGYHFQKFERLIDDYKLAINKDGYIVKMNYHTKTDYGEGFIDDRESTSEFSQFNEPILNTEYLDSLIQLGKEGKLKYGDTISLEF